MKWIVDNTDWSEDQMLAICHYDRENVHQMTNSNNKYLSSQIISQALSTFKLSRHLNQKSLFFLLNRLQQERIYFNFLQLRFPPKF